MDGTRFPPILTPAQAEAERLRKERELERLRATFPHIHAVLDKAMPGRSKRYRKRPTYRRNKEKSAP